MKSKLKQIIQKLTPWAVEDDFYSSINSATENGKFELLFQNEVIGTLEFNRPKWIFKYSESFKNDQFILPLLDFPDVNKVYEFEDLMPFFATRIPNFNQPYQEKKLNKFDGEKSNLVSLLKIFGEKSINNPYELKYI